MTRRVVACVAVPHFLALVAKTAYHCAPHLPLAVATTAADRGTLVDTCPLARQRGVRPGLSAYEARTQCHALVVTPVPTAAAAQHAETVEAALHQHADLLARERLGTWHLELRALGRGFRHADTIVAALHADVVAAATMDAAIGVGPTATVAMIAARYAWRDPWRRLVVLPGDEHRFLHPLAVDLLPGVGPKTTAALAAIGVTTIGQLAQLPAQMALQVLGGRARLLQARARGHDVDDLQAAPSRLASAWSFDRAPCHEATHLQALAHVLAERVGRRVRAMGQAAGTVTTTLVWHDGRQHGHTITLVPRCDLDYQLAAASREALDLLLDQRRLSVQRIDVCLGDLGARQVDLFDEPDERERTRQAAVDAIKHKHGTGAIRIARLFDAATRRLLS